LFLKWKARRPPGRHLSMGSGFPAPTIRYNTRTLLWNRPLPQSQPMPTSRRPRI
jgi:hypothetical protein